MPVGGCGCPQAEPTLHRSCRFHSHRSWLATSLFPGNSQGFLTNLRAFHSSYRELFLKTLIWTCYPLCRTLTILRKSQLLYIPTRPTVNWPLVGISGFTCHPLSSRHPGLRNSTPGICHVHCLDKPCSYFQTQLKFYPPPSASWSISSPCYPHRDGNIFAPGHIASQFRI